MAEAHARFRHFESPSVQLRESERLRVYNLDRELGIIRDPLRDTLGEPFSVQTPARIKRHP